MWTIIYKSLKRNSFVPDADKKKISSWHFLKWLGTHTQTILVANEINKYYNIPIINQFNMIQDAFGKRNVYIEFSHTSNDGSSHVEEAVMWHHNLSNNTIKEFMLYISEEEIASILELYDEFKTLT